MRLHEDKDVFKLIIDRVSSLSGINKDILEKDYYVTLLLEELSKKDNQGYAYFKGGTALYKCLHSIRRFSEDIDLTVDISSCPSKTQQRKRLKDSAKKFTCLGEGKVEEDNNGSITVSYYYDSLFDINLDDQLQRYGKVKIESTSFTVSEPVYLMEIAPSIYELSSEKDKILLDKYYDVKPFNIGTIKLERIFVDKIFATQFYFEREMYFDVAKHTYDLTVLMDNEIIVEFLNNKERFEEIVKLKRIEEEIRLGGVDKKLEIVDFAFFDNLESNNKFIEEFQRMQKMYVFNNNDRFEIFKVFNALKELKKIISK